MSINIIDNFSVNVSKPIDAKIVVADAAARIAISYKYIGLRTYQIDNGKFYYWDGSFWIDENSNLIGTSGIGVTGSFLYWSTYGTASNSSSLYFSASNIGVNDADPKEALQVTSQFWPSPSIGAPLTIHKGGSTVIGFNWYYNAGEFEFDTTRYSARIGFDDIVTGSMNFAYREPLDSYYTSLNMSSRVVTVSPRNVISLNTDVVNAFGSTVSVYATSSILLQSVNSIDISGTSSINLISATSGSGINLKTIGDGVIYGNFKRITTSGLLGTFSINTISVANHIEIVGGNFLFNGTNIFIKSGDGVPFKGPANGGGIKVIGGMGANGGVGGSASIIAGSVSGVLSVPGDVYLEGGYNSATLSRGYIYANTPFVTKGVYRNSRYITATNINVSYASTDDDHVIIINYTKFAISGSSLALPTTTAVGKSREMCIYNISSSGRTFDLLFSGYLEIAGTGYFSPYTMAPGESLHIYMDEFGNWYDFS